MELCKSKVSYISLGSECYFPCGKKAKYKVRFLKGTNGEPTEACVCGIHFRSIKKASERIMKKTGYNNKFEYEDISAT